MTTRPFGLLPWRGCRLQRVPTEQCNHLAVSGPSARGLCPVWMVQGPGKFSCSNLIWITPDVCGLVYAFTPNEYVCVCVK